jgi:DNA polymerase
VLLDLSPQQRGGLVRGALVAPPGKKLVVVDFSGIEARVLAWFAGDEPALQLFRDGGDPYKRVAAEAIFFVPIEEVTKDQRQIGKVAELALGYGMGWRKFEQNVGREKLEAAGVSAAGVVQQWRELRRPVVDLWGQLEQDWKLGCGFFEDYEDGTRRMILPSGRPIVYRDASYEGYIGRGGRLVRVYGGLLVENLVQATSRDLLAAAMVKAEAAGLTIVMHVHDEIVCEEDSDKADVALETLRVIMSEAEAPAWARGCPIGSEGYVAERYRK